MCLNPKDPQSLRIFSMDGAYQTLSGYSEGSGVQRHGILQPCSAWCFTQNVREEVRIIGGNGFGITERQVMYTLNTVDRHMVGICELDKEPAGKRRGKHEILHI